MKIETYAAIDIGSNAIRLLINNVDRSLKYPDFKKAAYIRVPIRLGEDVFIQGMISEAKKTLLLEAMSGFRHMMNAYQVKEYKACATSAMRDAVNGMEIVKSIRKTNGIDISIISGREEADMIYEAGGLDTMMDKNRNYLYVDVGGGSTEIVVYGDRRKITASSFQLGTVRLLTGKVTDEEMTKFKTWLQDIYARYAPLSIIASGGNINKVHKLLGKGEGEHLNYPETKVLYDTLKKMTYEERITNYKLNTYRADVIIPALKIFLTVSKICKTNEIHVPKLGLVDGIIHHLYNGAR
ncbi:MAG: hypothetical protein LUE98_18040 [Tannerellaceae bacterium]|nr:hypothetical protein [Tannerellaceae bacterium]